MNTPPPPLELRDIHLPDPVSWWPPAMGWWLVLLAIGLMLLLVWGWRHWSHGHRIKKTALHELEQLAQAYTQHQDAQQLTGAISALLRRISLTRHPRHQVAGLTGEAWLAFLDQGQSSQPFSQGPGRVLIVAPFQPHTPVNVDELLQVCRQWIQSLPREKRSGNYPGPPSGRRS